jgi:ribosomal protein L11 methylase PrmA
LALDEPELSPRELAVRFTDAERYFVSEASVYRLPKAHDLITSPAFITMKAADEFKNKTTAPNQLWQTDFTYLKVKRRTGDWRRLRVARSCPARAGRRIASVPHRRHRRTHE